ncbi:2-Hydroxyacid oxidase 1-like [Bacillus rossius redtenbacheri]|uniref:2-Hydroxyacid oxidase 1-like n=1 Tax=Bacillus rossius redtenbacheri TaxID=93214 RepID=UPI002FDD3F49
MSSLVCVDDYERHALRILPRSVVDFHRGGAGEEHTLRRNRTAFQSWYIRPRVMRDVSCVDLRASALGCEASMPCGVAPTSMQRLVHADGECAAARAAGEAGTVFILSTLSTSSVEEVAAAAPDTTKWFQLYIYKDRSVTRELVARAERAGFKALVVTVDSAVYGMRRADMRCAFSLPAHLRMANFSEDMAHTSGGEGLLDYVNNLYDQGVTWKDITWLRSITKLPIAVKGVLTAEDARTAVEVGVSAIFVSNHGGRQLDTVPAAIEALPEVARAVGGRAEVYLDGGVRQGTDVFKALALGARMVFLGRPALWGLAHSGQRGVRGVLDIVRAELRTVMALSGCTSVSDITPAMVAPASTYSRL